MDDSTLFELWKAIYTVRLMIHCCAPEKRGQRTAEFQQHYLEHSIVQIEDGIRKEAALAAFRRAAAYTERSREIIRRIDEK